MADENRIDIPITSEGVLGIRNAIMVIKEAYKQNAAKQIVDDENAILPLTLEQLKGVKNDLIASKGTVDNYYKMTADDKRDLTTSNLSSYKDLDRVSGNYPITDKINQEIKKDLNLMVNSDGKHSLGSTETMTSSFKDESKDAFSNFNDRLNSGIERNNRVYKPEEFLQEGEAPRVSTSTAEYSRRYEGKSKGSIINECIPCDFRKFNLDQIQPMTDLLAVLEQDLVEKYRRILSQFRDLLTNNEINEDLCSLLNFLNFQCIPDIFGMISVLQMMLLKLTDVSLVNPSGAFMSLLQPFFAPILNGVNELLDKYIQLILGPVDCIINSLDTQLAKLDVGSALDQGRRAELNLLLTERSRLERKKQSLIDRKNFLLETGDDGEFVNQPGSYKITDLRNEPTEVNVGGFISENFGFKVTREEELAKIDEELTKMEGAYGKGGQLGELNRKIDELRATQPRPNLISNARGEVRAFRNTLGKSLEDLRLQLIRGKNMINDTATAMRKELTRLILGRAESSEEMLQGAMEIQRIARMIGICKTMIRLVNKGKLCENSNDPAVALGNFLTSNRQGESASNRPNFYRGTDQTGQPVLLVTTSDAVLNLLDEGRNESAPLNNIEEIQRLNDQGVAPDIGTIAQKSISAQSQTLGVQVPVSVVRFNLCGEVSASTSETIDNIKSWASNLG